MANTFTTAGSDPNVGGVYPQEYADSVQRRLNDVINWKDTCDWMLSSSNTLNFPYMSTEFTAQSGTRGTAYSFSDFTITNDQVRIVNQDVVPVYVDYADLAQFTLLDWIRLGERMGQVVNTRVGTLVLAQHASWTDFDNASIGGAAGNITVSATNIDDIVRGVSREIGEANGMELAAERGMFIEWRFSDKEYLEQYAQANGFQLADAALKNGIPNAYYFMGMHHYVSNRHTAGHLFAGVRKTFQLGLLRSTWGRLLNSPSVNGDGPLSGEGRHYRLDYGFNAPTAHTTVLFDINVN